jgi:hypothetical protein
VAEKSRKIENEALREATKLLTMRTIEAQRSNKKFPRKSENEQAQEQRRYNGVSLKANKKLHAQNFFIFSQPTYFALPSWTSPAHLP